MGEASCPSDGLCKTSEQVSKQACTGRALLWRDLDLAWLCMAMLCNVHIHVNAHLLASNAILQHGQTLDAFSSTSTATKIAGPQTR